LSVATIFFVDTAYKWIGRLLTMKPTIVPSRVIELRKSRSMSQKDLADEVGVTQQAINAIESGQVSRPTKLRELAEVLGADEAYLLGLTDDVIAFVDDLPGGSGETVTIRGTPVATRVPDLAIFAGMGGGGMLEVSVDDAGVPTDPDQVRGYWEFPDYMLRRFGDLKNIYAWEVRGDSMEPTLSGGAVVFVDTSQTKLPPDDIYAINYGDGLMVKRLKLVPRSELVSVISDNDRYGADDLIRDDVKVWGRVIGWFQWRG
jgi:transcriptional regulator with XRE-family HTH domain